MLILLRHGESEANAGNSFSGWLDVPLSERGRAEAAQAGALLVEHGIAPTVVHTSVLVRAVDTADIAMARLGGAVPTRRTWRLNERHYGALQGCRRAAIRARYGDAQFARWRRSYDAAPPPLPADDPMNPHRDPRYADVPPGDLPATESLADVRRRLVPYWAEAIAPDLDAGATVLVVAHSNSLRALCMHLDRLTPAEVESLNIPTGVPLRYFLGRDRRPVPRDGHYLDPAAAESGIREVADQGVR
jgi:2,3-bisphosphoglycerate-dependent phosphoglycerate mutase